MVSNVDVAEILRIGRRVSGGYGSSPIKFADLPRGMTGHIDTLRVLSGAEGDLTCGAVSGLTGRDEIVESGYLEELRDLGWVSKDPLGGYRITSSGVSILTVEDSLSS